MARSPRRRWRASRRTCTQDAPCASRRLVCGWLGTGEAVQVAEGVLRGGLCGAGLEQPLDHVAVNAQGDATFGGFAVVSSGAGENESAESGLQRVESGHGVDIVRVSGFRDCVGVPGGVELQELL